jgi:hypothetical protein
LEVAINPTEVKMTAQMTDEIKKLHLKETIQFATNNIPGADERTLEALLNLATVDGTHGAISPARLVGKMRQVVKYVPGACPRSLAILADLLELPLPNPPAALQGPESERVMSLAQILRTTMIDEASLAY